MNPDLYNKEIPPSKEYFYNQLLLNYKNAYMIFYEAELLMSSGIELRKNDPFMYFSSSDEIHQAIIGQKTQIQEMITNSISLTREIINLIGFFNGLTADYHKVGESIKNVDDQVLKIRINSFCETLKSEEEEIKRICDTLSILERKEINKNMLENFLTLLRTEELQFFIKSIEEEQIKIDNNKKIYEEMITNKRKDINTNLELYYIIKNKIDLNLIRINNLESEIHQINYSIAYLMETINNQNEDKSINSNKTTDLIKSFVVKETQDLQEIEKKLMKQKNIIDNHYLSESRRLNNELNDRRNKLLNEQKTKTTRINGIFLIIELEYDNPYYKELEYAISYIERLKNSNIPMKKEALESVIYNAEKMKQECRKYYESLQKIENINEDIQRNNFIKFQQKLEQRKQVLTLEKNNISTIINLIKIDTTGLESKNHQIQITIDKLQALIKSIQNELDQKNKLSTNKIIEFNESINRKLTNSGHHFILDYATSIQIFINNFFAFKRRIGSFASFFKILMDNLNLESRFLIKTLDESPKEVDLVFDKDFLEIWVKDAFPENQAFQNVVLKDFSIYGLVELFNYVDENTLKENLFLTNIQYKSMQSKIKTIEQEKKCEYLKRYVLGLIERIERVTRF